MCKVKAMPPCIQRKKWCDEDFALTIAIFDQVQLSLQACILCNTFIEDNAHCSWLKTSPSTLTYSQ